MKKNKLVFIVAFKVIVLFFVYVLNLSLQLVVSPIIANDLAMLQMSSTTDSSVWIALYSYYSQYSWILFVMLIIIVMFKEMRLIASKIIKIWRKS